MRSLRLAPFALFVPVCSLAWPSVAHAQPPPAGPPPAAVQEGPPSPPPAPAPPGTGAEDGARATAGLTSLRLLLAKGVISQAEYDSALHDVGESTGARAADSSTVVLGKWATTFYGFVEGDAIYDTTQSLNEIAGNSPIAKSGTFAGDHDRMQFSVRNSRFGFRLKAPEVNDIRASAQLEMDFFGGAAPASGAESTVFNNPVLRTRHMNLKIETPIVDLLIGQYWVLFGWQAQYLPATVQVQGIPGEVFSRQMQIRVSKTVKTPDVTFEAAVAALRPAQRDGGLPVGQGGLRLAFTKWTAPQTLNFAGTSVAPLSLAVTGDLRRVRLPEVSAEPHATNERVGGSVAVDAFIPVVPGTKESKGNSLALNGELTTGYGQGDLYTGLTGGVTTNGLLPALPNPNGTAPAPTYDPRIDNGIASYDSKGNLRLVQWTTYLAGIQYYFPGAGNVFASANYSHAESANTSDFGAPKSTRRAEDFFDVNLFWDVTSAVRVAAELAHFMDTYNNGEHAFNNRVQCSGAFLF